MNAKQREKLEAIEKLRKNIEPGDIVYTILRHVSSSGMSRIIDVYTIKDNVPLRWSWSVATAIGATYDKKHEGVKVNGCGMDMGYHVVDSLSHALFWTKGETYAEYKAKKLELKHRWI